MSVLPQTLPCQALVFALPGSSLLKQSIQSSAIVTDLIVKVSFLVFSEVSFLQNKEKKKYFCVLKLFLSNLLVMTEVMIQCLIWLNL